MCDVNKGLLSVGKMVENGHKVVFEKDDGRGKGSYIEDTVTKQRMWMTEGRGLYMLKLWIQNQGKQGF